MISDRELIVKAFEAQNFCYTPYSNFNVGAALLGTNGKVYQGCNIENAAFSPTNCAERTAFFKAVSEGEHSFVKIAIVSSSGDFTFPCGICRQVLSEFMPEGRIVLCSAENGIEEFTLEELLPYAFKL